MKKVSKHINLIIVLLSLAACAQQVAPTGGPKDEEPPEILGLTPPQETLHYSNQTIEITFNEFVKLDRLKQQLLISPPLKYDLETKIRGKRLEIEIKDTLKKNTTYVLNFGDAIVDITENNPISGFTYVFSTGSHIDTMSVSGRLVNAFTLEVEEGALVMLYDTSDLDSIPFKEIPTYVDRTDEGGRFKVTNIKRGTYSIFALKDGNTNYLFDQPDESIAFIDSTFRLTKNIDSLKLYGFVEDRQKQFIESQKEEGPKLTLDFKNPLHKFQINAIDTNLKEILINTEIGLKKDTATLWFEQLDDRELKVEIQDEGYFKDTLEVKVDSLNGKDKLKLINKLGGRKDFYKPMTLLFNRPVKKLDSGKLFLFKADSSKLDFRLELDSGDKHKVRIQAKLDQDSSYFIHFYPGAFIDLYNRTTDTTKAEFSLNSERDFGNLSVVVTSNYSGNKIIQLISGKDKVVEEKPLKGGKTLFRYLKAGQYGLKLIFDANENGKWDTGNYLEKVQPEKVWIYDENITIRSNWDQEIEWILK